MFIYTKIMFIHKNVKINDFLHVTDNFGIHELYKIVKITI